MSDVKTIENRIKINGKPAVISQIVYLRWTEECWTKPFPRKSHHSAETRSVLLQAEITDIDGDEFKAKLFGNNGFEKDGQEFVFHKGTLLCQQNFTRMDELGKWIQDQSSNS